MNGSRWLAALGRHVVAGLVMLGTSATFVPWPWPAKGRVADSTDSTGNLFRYPVEVSSAGDPRPLARVYPIRRTS